MIAKGTFRYTKVYISTNPEDSFLIRKGGGKLDRTQINNHQEFIENGGDKYITEYVAKNPDRILIDENNLPYENPNYQTILTERKWDEIKAERNRLLQESDYTQLPDAPFTNEEIELWQTYRQALRDITLNKDPFNITWPITP
jgi:hypothetical protein